jgi:allantoinase
VQALRGARRRARRPRPHQRRTPGRLERGRRARAAGACRERIARESGQAPAGWLSPWISESPRTPDLLAETGYGYTLNWCHDDQPVPMRTRSGAALWSVPYPQELNDIPMIMARQMDARDFFALVQDNFEEMLEQSRAQPLVMGLALHPYIVGQPHRLRTCARRWKRWRARATPAASGSPRRARSRAHAAAGGQRPGEFA